MSEAPASNVGVPRPLEPGPAPLFSPQAPPIPLTPLVGRVDERRALTALLSDPAVRLVTLTGPGGVGKTRLALEVAAEIAEVFADDVAYVDLAPVLAPSLVGATIAQALSVREAGDRPIVIRLIEQLRRRDLLLVLDNFEHLLPAAPLVAELMASCPHLTVLVTSRAPTSLNGERIFAVAPLPLDVPMPADDAQDLRASRLSDASRLFLDRAMAARADFRLTERNTAAIAEICRRVDGLPLAIELAAARCLALSPESLLSRMDQRLPLLVGGPRDTAPRQRSLREAIAWSYDLLATEEQAAFRRLAVFAGGFTLEAAEEVSAFADGQTASWKDGEREDGRRKTKDRGIAGTQHLSPIALGSPAPPERSGSPFSPSAPSSTTLDLVTTLVAKSLLTRHDVPDGSVRFGMLETIREFGLDRLAVSGEESWVRRRHAAHYLGIVERQDRLMPRPDRWWEPFEVEWANLRSALAWTVAAGETGIGLRLGGEIFGYWMLRGQIGEGINWLEQLLAASTGEPPEPRGRAALALCSLYWITGDLDQAELLGAESEALARSEGDTIGVAVSRFVLGLLAEARGELRAAAEQLTVARDVYAAADLAPMAAAVAAHLGRIVGRLGDRIEAEKLLAAAIPILDREDGGHWGAALAYVDLGLLVADSGDLARAASLVEQGLRRLAAIGDQLVFLIALAAAAQIAATAGDSAAARLLGATKALRAQSGPSIWAVALPIYERAEALSRRSLGEQRFVALWEEGSAFSLDVAMATARRTLERITQAEPAQTPRSPSPLPVLSPRELAVLRLVMTGQTDREIAVALGLQVRTVNTYVANARRKLGAQSRAAAVAEVVRRGLA